MANLGHSNTEFKNNLLSTDSVLFLFFGRSSPSSGDKIFLLPPTILLVFCLVMDEEDNRRDDLSSFSFNDSTVTKAERCENNDDCCCLSIDAMSGWVDNDEAGGEKADEGCDFSCTPLLVTSVVVGLNDEKIDLSCCCSCCCWSSFRLPIMSEILLPAKPDKFNPLVSTLFLLMLKLGGETNKDDFLPFPVFSMAPNPSERSNPALYSLFLVVVFVVDGGEITELWLFLLSDIGWKADPKEDEIPDDEVVCCCCCCERADVLLRDIEIS